MNKSLYAAIAVLALGATTLRAATAAENWSNECARCHGADGRGETRMGRERHIKDYTDSRFQAEFKDVALLRSILLGITIDGRERMPAFDGKLTAADAKALVAYIRKFAVTPAPAASSR